MSQQEQMKIVKEEPSREEASSQKAAAPDPFLLVIFGASGDLTARKIIPSLFKLYLHRLLPDRYAILGCSRTKLSAGDFRKKMQKACVDLADSAPEQWRQFAERLHYQSISYDAQPAYEELSWCLKNLDQEYGTGWHRIFYLAVPPSLLPQITKMIGRAQLAAEQEEKAWSRIVVEKPFGRDLGSALELDRILHQSFAEHQIFRIDHYLAKEPVQNILMFRFANTIFEPVWNRSHIDYVGILSTERLGVEHRAGYYEQAGVLRDMFQNHMMQLLALAAMEPPSAFDADRIRDEKVKVFQALKSMSPENQGKNLILGQYGAGRIDGQEVAAYRDEPKVDAESIMPTFAIMRVFIDNWRWQGVPFFLASGKRLASKQTRLVVQFKKVPHSMFAKFADRRIAANRLALDIYPDEEIKLTFETKIPGPRVNLRTVTMQFNYHGEKGQELDAYEKVLLDVMAGEKMLFWRKDGVERCWTFLTPILEESESCKDRSCRLHFYESGSWGPKAAREWMGRIIND
jgi:glucose-6-phosphate 1-dehydrogenase